MNVLDRLKINIEGYTIQRLTKILRNEDEEVKKILDVFDSIVLNNNKTIKCIRNYYIMNNIRNYKKYSAMQLCSLIQKDNNIKCKPYNCTECHLEMLKRLKNNTVFLQNDNN